MLTISNGTARYYASLAERDDYYHKGKEPPGLWHGQGAAEFGLAGEVDKQTFYALCAGLHPETDEKLAHHAGTERRRALWDCTFSAPKGVSCWWAMTGDEETRERISECHLRAVKAALDYAEASGIVGTRTGTTGRELDPCRKLFFALYEHATSRELDPELHTHAVMINLGINGEGKTRTLDPIEMLRAKMFLGAIYRAEFSRNLQQEFAIEPERLPKGMFDIKGVPDALKDDCSKRRKQIVAALEQGGRKGGKAANIANFITRKEKEYKEREELFKEWGELGKRHGLNEREIINRREFVPDTWERTRESVDKVVADITRENAYFTERDLLHKLAIEAQYTGASFRECQEVAERYLSTSAVHLRTEDGRKIYTTPEIDQLEKRMLSQAIEGREKEFAPLKKTRPVDVSHLSDEQKRALHHITEERGDIKLVSGMAGTGKTTLLKTAREAYESRGYEVIGASLAAVAAKNLEAESGIKSSTIHRLLWKIEEASKAEQGRRPQENPLSPKTVLVIDEAGMVGTRQMARLIDETKKAGAKLVLAGDERQLQPIEHGAPFKAIGELIGRAELKDIKRQGEQWAREAVHDFADGKANAGLVKYLEQGLLTIKSQRAEVVRELIDTWQHDPTNYRGKVIIASTRAQVKELNDLAQKVRQEQGELGAEAMTVNGYELHTGDRIIFKSNYHKIGVLNGETATVKALDREKQVIAVRMDEGELRVIPTQDCHDIALAYAYTTHALQGNTKTNAYVMIGSTMEGKELSYVKLSRHRGTARIFAAVEDVGESLATMAKLMNRSTEKHLAQEQREQRPADIERDRRPERGVSI